jgi:SH3-like domain-containing protein
MPAPSPVVIEEKKEVVVQPQVITTPTEVKKEEVKKEEVKKTEILPSEVTLTEAQYIYKEPNEKSQKTWMFKKGTQVTIVKEHSDWVGVRDAQGRKGFVKKDILDNKQQ